MKVIKINYASSKIYYINHNQRNLLEIVNSKYAGFIALDSDNYIHSLKIDKVSVVELDELQVFQLSARKGWHVKQHNLPVADEKKRIEITDETRAILKEKLYRNLPH